MPIKEDTTDWSYVYFGSYPQSEVTGEGLTEDIVGADYDENGDAYVDGVKYRRVSEDDVEDDSYFEDSEYCYFKWERIRWRVLANDGETLFVMADSGLDWKRYNDNKTSKSVAWEDCTLRGWLNEIFYGVAFDSAEQAAIVPQTAVNEDNPDYETEEGNAIVDNIYLLSNSEVRNPAYGFCEADSAFLPSRQAKTSEYAYVMGDGNNQWWLLRSYKSNKATYINEYGAVTSKAVSYKCAVVPVLHISLDSGLGTLMDGRSDDVGEEKEIPVNSVHHCVKEDITDWNYVYFGSYPQSEVRGEALTGDIVSADYNANGDAWVNGTKYRRVSNRYFKWERIRWRVLANDGETLFVMADSGLDCQGGYTWNQYNWLKKLL